MIKLKDDAAKSAVQKWIIGSLKDPILRTLLKNSHLTKTQLETFLIDILAERVTGKAVIYEKKAKLRLLKSGVSRGAFNRTLAQSRRNITKAIYTIILLGYLGVFESPCLEPYLEMATKIRTYTEAYKDLWKGTRASGEHLRIMNLLQKEIEKGLEELSRAKSMSRRA